ncbi:aspartate-semialdehyde dehydrogenase [Shewanella woodyi]|uniref:aspartate-semialdehyde dehydrogenase n=1 Tax=Shewanella woodyi TaxID=60961 RepID=UPI0007F980CE|nr:aspartate-semialdehyde dehydrogenase [Shewanella woodyi]
MSESVVKEVLVKALKELEESGDIVVVNTIENAIANKLHEVVKEVSPNMLTAQELGGIINALNAHNLGFGLDDNDFQAIIGLTKEELKIAASKLKVAEW